MPTFKEKFLAILNNDSALDAIMDADFLYSDTLPFDGLTPDNIQTSNNGVTIVLQGVVKFGSLLPMRGPERAVRRFAEIYLYDDPTEGFDNIDNAKRRIWELFHQKNIGAADDVRMAWSIWVGDLGSMYDDELRANMDRMRFQIDTTRKSTS